MGELLQPTHLLLIFIVAVLLFGPKKLPELGKGIGEGIRALKDGMKDSSSEAPKSAETEVQSNRSKS
jgi:sec-independent protein translocase protein TatA